MMNRQELWNIFSDTGDPLAYVMYSRTAQEPAEDTPPKEGEEAPCSSISPSPVS